MTTQLSPAPLVTALTVIGLLLTPAFGADNRIWLSSKDPPSTQDTANLTSGMHLAQQRRYEKAAKFFNLVENLDVVNYRAVQQICETYVMSGDFSKALHIAEYLLARNTKGEQVTDFEKGITVKLKADAEAGQEHYDLAVQDYKTAVKLKPDSTYFILCTAGEILMKTHRYKEAIEILNKAVAAGCPNGLGYKHLGECHLRLNQPEEAIKAIKISLSTIDGIRKTKPDAFSIALISNYKNLATAYRMEGKTALAADAQKHAESMTASWDDTLFGAAPQKIKL